MYLQREDQYMYVPYQSVVLHSLQPSRMSVILFAHLCFPLTSYHARFILSPCLSHM